MEPDKIFQGPITLTIDGQDPIEFKLHSFYDVLEAFIEPQF